MEEDELDVQDGRKPSEGEAFFLGKYWEMKSNSPDKHDEIAKSFITTVGILTTIYFGVVAFSMILTKPWWFKSIAIVPILLWLFAIKSALVGLLPQKYTLLRSVPASVEQFLEEVTEHKYRCVRRCGWFILAGLAVLMVTLVLYLSNVG